MKKPVLIFGAGGLGREVLSLLNALNEWEPCGFIDDEIPVGTEIKHLKVVGGTEALRHFSETIYLVLAVGDPSVKAAILKRVTNPHVRYPVLCHPSVILQHEDTIRIGRGSVIAAGVIITTDVVIGEHVLINLNTTIGHDTKIGNFCSVMPGVNLAGQVTIGDEVLIGSGANVRNNVNIGDRCIVGMGAAVIRSVNSGLTVAGVPAKPIRQ